MAVAETPTIIFKDIHSFKWMPVVASALASALFGAPLAKTLCLSRSAGHAVLRATQPVQRKLDAIGKALVVGSRSFNASAARVAGVVTQVAGSCRHTPCTWAAAGGGQLHTSSAHRLHVLS